MLRHAHGGCPARNRERGQATLESLGAFTIAAILAVAVILGTLGQGTVIGDSFKYQICKVLAAGGMADGCTNPAVAHPDKPDKPCVLGSHEGEANVKVDFMFFQAKNGLNYKAEFLPDGKVRITQTAKRSGGVGVGLGEDFAVGPIAEAAHGGAEANLKFSSGSTYILNSQDDLPAVLTGLGVDLALEETIPGGSFFRPGIDWLGRKLGVTSPLPQADTVFIEGGESAEASIKGQLGPAEGKLGGEVNAALGIKVKPSTGETTTYFKADMKGSAAWGVQVEGSQATTIEVDRDSSGKVTKVRVKVTSKKQGGAADVAGGTVDENVYQLDISKHPEDAVLAQKLLVANHVPPIAGLPDIDTLIDGANPLNIVEIDRAFMQAAQHHGMSTREESVLASAKSKVGGTIGEGAKAGITVDGKYTGTALIKSEYWDGRNWVQREDCPIHG